MGRISDRKGLPSATAVVIVCQTTVVGIRLLGKVAAVCLHFPTTEHGEGEVIFG